MGVSFLATIKECILSATQDKLCLRLGLIQTCNESYAEKLYYALEARRGSRSFGSRSSPQISLFLDTLVWCATFNRWMALLVNAQKGNDCASYSESVMPLISYMSDKKGRDSQLVT